VLEYVQCGWWVHYSADDWTICSIPGKNRDSLHPEWVDLYLHSPYDFILHVSLCILKALLKLLFIKVVRANAQIVD
jgi:hypothetical protein